MYTFDCCLNHNRSVDIGTGALRAVNVVTMKINVIATVVAMATDF